MEGDSNKLSQYEFEYVERPNLQTSDQSYGLSSQPLDGEQAVEGYTKLVGDVDEAFTVIQQNEDQISLVASDVDDNTAAISLNSGEIDLRVKEDEVISSINLSPETITINAENISIDGTTTFSSGYDPSVKLESSDVGDLAFEDLVEQAKLGTTVIDGGYIVTDLLTADNIQAGTLEGVTVKQTDNTGESITLETNTAGLPQINFIDENVDVGNIIGDANYSTTIAGSTYILDAIRTDKSFIAGNTLLAETNVLVNNQVVVGDGIQLNRDTTTTNAHMTLYNDGTGAGELYSKTDNNLYWKPSGQTEIQLGSGEGVNENEQDLGISSGTISINRSLAKNQKLTVGGDLDITFVFDREGYIQLKIINGGNYTVTWGNNIDWAEGVAPNLTANGMDYVNIHYNGTTYSGDYGYNFN